MNKDQVQVVHCQASTHDGDEQRQSSVEHYIECPSCFNIFPVNEIAEHADKCVDIWIGEVQVEDSENESETDTDLPDPGFIDAKPADTSLKNVAQQLADVHVKKEQPKSY
jgi:hypothetical protein